MTEEQRSTGKSRDLAFGSALSSAQWTGGVSAVMLTLHRSACRPPAHPSLTCEQDPNGTLTFPIRAGYPPQPGESTPPFSG